MALLLILLVPAVIALSAVLSGWVLSIMWGWFFVPILGLPILSIPQAIGISLVVSYLTHQKQPSTKNKDETTETIIYAFLSPFFTLLFGWIVKSFM